jgi:hypothetical protein
MAVTAVDGPCCTGQAMPMPLPIALRRTLCVLAASPRLTLALAW